MQRILLFVLLSIGLVLKGQTNTSDENTRKDKKMNEMRRVELDFFENPQFKIKHVQKIHASKEEVFQFLKGAENWPKWHTSITKVIWTSEEPYEKGTTRTVVINDKYTADEDFLIWEENERFVFRFLRSDIPMATALAEDFQLRDLGDGYCELSMTVAGETKGVLRLFNWVMKLINQKGIEKSLTNLAAYFENLNGTSE